MKYRWLNLLKRLEQSKRENKEYTLKPKEINLILFTIHRFESLTTDLLKDNEEMMDKILELLYLKNIIQEYIAEFHPRTLDTYMSSMCDDHEQSLFKKYFTNIRIDEE